MKDLHDLIKEITPLYNEYKAFGDKMTWAEALYIMRDVGQMLDKYISEAKISPHTLYRKVYWKSEWKENFIQKSYITREFMWRCYRIFHIFASKELIYTELPNLRSFTSFREAMPFFDNKKHKLVWKDREQLLNLLNSDQSSKLILEQLSTIKKREIGITNPRTQKLSELDDDKKVFIDFYNTAYRLVNSRDYKEVLNELKKQWVTIEYIKILSKNTHSIIGDEIRSYDMDIPSEASWIWKLYWEFINKMISERNLKVQRRFRRIIDTVRISRLSSILYAFTSEEYYNKFN